MFLRRNVIHFQDSLVRSRTSMMNIFTMMKDLLQKRFEELGISQAELARRIAEKRQEPGKVVKPDNLQSAISNALKDPDSRRHRAILELIEAMDGEVVIRWKDYKEVKIP
jgi:ribosome-binding protein aMBF1 (putative translation factor)